VDSGALNRSRSVLRAAASGRERGAVVETASTPVKFKFRH